MKIILSEIPDGVKKVILKPEWQYRINGGYTTVTFLKEGEEFDPKTTEYDETVEGSGRIYQHIYSYGILVSDLAKKCFSAAVLRKFKENEVTFYGDDGSGDGILIKEDELIYSVQNSDS